MVKFIPLTINFVFYLRLVEKFTLVIFMLQNVHRYYFKAN